MAQTPSELTVHVISDSLGDTAADLVKAAGAQFGDAGIRIERLTKVTGIEEVRRYVRGLGDRASGALAVYTIVDRDLRLSICDELAHDGVVGIDLLGPILDAISGVLGTQPRGQAGANRQVDERYFRRIDAMDFFVNHDDGRNPQDLTLADIVLVGVSRTSKTPLSMYLSLLGYKVANVPLARGVEPPRELFDVDPRRIYGLMSTPERLATIRADRLVALGGQGVADSYADVLTIEEELDEARALLRKLGCIVVKTSGRAIEETAQIILGYYERVDFSR